MYSIVEYIVYSVVEYIVYSIVEYIVYSVSQWLWPGKSPGLRPRGKGFPNGILQPGHSQTWPLATLNCVHSVVIRRKWKLYKINNTRTPTQNMTFKPKSRKQESTKLLNMQPSLPKTKFLVAILGLCSLTRSLLSICLNHFFGEGDTQTNIATYRLTGLGASSVKNTILS